MKKFQALLAVGCLSLGIVGCQTDDGVQKGYLTPDQTAPSSSSSSSTTASADSGPTTGERLPPPSVTQDVAKAETSSEAAASEAAPSSTPAADSSAPETTSTPPAASPTAIAQNDQRPGGKVGATGSSLRREPGESRNQEPEPESKAASREEEKEPSEGDQIAAKPASQSPVSSNLSSGSTRILSEPTGSAKGVVLKVNDKAKFVVIKFQYRAVPSVGKVLSVMRNGVKVGQIRMTKPIKSPHGTADIIEGDVQRGDTVE
jgi:hypothetical protein